VNSFENKTVLKAIERALSLARISPNDKFNSLPHKKEISYLDGIFDRTAESFQISDAIMNASEMLKETKSIDRRISIDSGNFTSSLISHALVNSNGIIAEESISSFSWSVMGMALDGQQVSNFDFQFGGCHNIKEIDVLTSARDFAHSVIKSLYPKRIDSFKGEMILTPSAASELIQDVLAHSFNSHAVQKGSSVFEGKIGQEVSSNLLNLEDDATNTVGLGSSSFDREGVPHRPNTIIEKGILKKYIYDTYTANKDNTESTGNAGGSPKSSPMVSTTNFIIKHGNVKLDTLISEISEGLIINRFSGNVNPVNGDFSGVVKGGQYIKNGEIKYAVKEVMLAGNVFDAINNLTGLSIEHKSLGESIMPYMRFSDISFTAG
jgi:PmbA protein